jgi:hypothetical protein
MTKRYYGVRSFLWAALAIGPAAGCLSAPTPQEVLATGFRTPEQTFDTFKTALRGDLIDLEYRCLSSEYKANNGISQLAYRVGRVELLQKEPFFKLVATAEVVDRIELSPRHVRLLARVDAFLTERSFHIDFVREDFYESGDAKGPIESDYAPWSSIARQVDDKLVMVAPMPEGCSIEQITYFNAGSEWKIHGFMPLEAP